MSVALTVKNLTVAYENEIVLDNIFFAVEKGAITAIIGPNGSGKTTLLKAMMGLIPWAAGEVKLFGKAPAEVRTDIGYVPQRFTFDKHFPITVREFLSLSVTPRAHVHFERKCTKDGACDPIGEKLREVGMAGAELKLLGELSGGQLQRVLLARAVLNEPRILFLDEPGTGIDIGGEDTLYDLIMHLNREHHTTVVFVSHEMAMVFRYATQVICVNKALLCSGVPSAVLDASTLRALYGEHVSGYHHV